MHDCHGEHRHESVELSRFDEIGRCCRGGWYGFTVHAKRFDMEADCLLHMLCRFFTGSSGRNTAGQIGSVYSVTGIGLFEDH